jgi:TonB family protein
MRAFTVLLAAVIGLGVAGGAGAGQEQVYTPGELVTAPRVIREVKPQYTPEALTAGVEGRVVLECVVGVDGKVSEARVTTPLRPDLDRKALDALGEWLFVPGQRDGKPVRVRVEVEMTFTLRDAAVPQGPPLGSPEVYLPGSGVTLPSLVYERKPGYTPEAMRERVQGRVKLECVVLADGRVGDIRVMEPLHPGLDQEATRALRRWTFKPGTKDGAPVPVRVEVEMSFTLRMDPKKL